MTAMSTEPYLLNNFRSPNTSTGSYRCYAHGWSGADAVYEAVQKLVNGDAVELHICDSSYGDSQDNKTTRHVMLMKIEDSHRHGEPRVLRYTFDASPDSTLCEANIVRMAAHISSHLFHFVKDTTDIFLQPNATERELFT